MNGFLLKALAAVVMGVSLFAVAGCGGAGAKAKTDWAGKPGGDSLAAGDAALSRGDRAEAGRLYQAALKAGADAAKVHTRLGDLHLGAGNFPQARTSYQDALKANPKFAPALQGVGFALYLSGAKGPASEALAKALAIEPGLSRAAALLGAIEAREGRPEAALAIYDKSLAVVFDPDVENNRGLALLMLGRGEDAAEAFRKAAAGKKNPKFVNNLALALCKLGRYDEAYTVFAGVATEAVALNNVGVCYMEAGNKAKAQAYFERAIAANPRFYPLAQENLTKLSAVEEVNLPAVAPGAAAPAQTAPPQPAPAPTPQQVAPHQPAVPAQQAAPAPVQATPPVDAPPVPPASTQATPSQTPPAQPVQSRPAAPAALPSGAPKPFTPSGTAAVGKESRPASTAVTTSKGTHHSPAAAEKLDRGEMP